MVGSEDLNDVLFVGRRIKWVKRKDPLKMHIQVDQESKLEELSELAFDSSLRDDITCASDLHKQYPSVLGQIKRPQSLAKLHADDSDILKT